MQTAVNVFMRAIRTWTERRADREGKPALHCAAAGYDRSFGQVWSIQVYVDVGSPLGHPGGAVIFRIGIVNIRLGSRTRNGRFLSLIEKPVIASLYAWWLSGRIWMYPARDSQDRPSSS